MSSYNEVITETSSVNNANTISGNAGSYQNLTLGTNNVYTGIDAGTVDLAKNATDAAINTTAALAQSVVTGQKSTLNDFLNAITNTNQAALQVVKDNNNQTLTALANKEVSIVNTSSEFMKYAGYAVIGVIAYLAIDKLFLKRR